MAQLIADWNPLGRDIFYRKFQLYSMAWSDRVNVGQFTLAAATCAGPIAIVRDDNKWVQVTTASGKPTIFIFSASGRAMSSIKWTGDAIIALGWTNSEDLLVVQDDGVVQMYTMFGQFLSTFSMGQEAKATKVLQCKLFNGKVGTGVAIITLSYRIFMVNDVRDPRIRKLVDIPGFDSPPTCWDVLCPDDELRLLVAMDGGNGVVHVLDQMEKDCQQQRLEFSDTLVSLTDMAVTLNGKHVAFLTSEGVLWMGSSDLQKRYCEFTTRCQSRPKQLVWCGSGAVVIYWDDLLLVVGINNACINFALDSPSYIVPEMDGVRIIGNYSHEFLQRVPDVVAQIFKIGSMAPGAILLEAFKEFQKKSHRADDYIRTVKNQLEEAMSQCVEAAGHEFVPSTQKMLLRAASFGKGFLPEISPQPFVTMCNTLRVLNSIRDYIVGLPLTYTQLKYLSMPVLLDRLVLRRQHCLAIKICQYLRIPDTEGASRILAHWACYKVNRMDLDEEQLAKGIGEKLGYSPGISYSEIANKAAECGRTQLAIKLLDYETRASEQVPLLMKLKQDLQAMSKAIDSGDTDLVYTVILHLRTTLTSGDFQMTIRRFPMAHCLYLKYCKEQSLNSLRDMYYQEDNFFQEAHCRLIESYQSTRMVTPRVTRLKALELALESYKKSKNDFAATQTEDQIRLLRYQERLEEKFDQEFLDQSLHETMHKLFLARQPKLVDELKREFKVPEKRFWWLKINSLAEMGEWQDLEKFSKSKKSPIGYEPFVEACVRNKCNIEAEKYLPRVQDVNKVRYYVKVGLFEDAANIALDQKDEQALIYVRSRCGTVNKALADKILTMMAQLNTKRST